MRKSSVVVVTSSCGFPFVFGLDEKFNHFLSFTFMVIDFDFLAVFWKSRKAAGGPATFQRIL